MEELEKNDSTNYEPRPAWQVWGARIGVVVCIILVFVQVIAIYRGGL